MISAKVAKIKSMYFKDQVSDEQMIWQSILDWDTYCHIPKMYCDANKLRSEWYEVYESSIWSEYYLVSWDM